MKLQSFFLLISIITLSISCERQTLEVEKNSPADESQSSLKDTPPVSLSLNPANGVEDTETIITLNYTDVDSDLATNCTLSSTNNIDETTPCSCDGAGLCTVGVTGTSGYFGPASFNYTITANGNISNIATVNFIIDSAVLSCPTGFIAINGNGLLGTLDFCVMKFEAKCSGSTDGTSCNTATDIPISQTANLPWRTNVTAHVAYDACARITEGGYTGEFRLIATPEWMTIARDIEATSSNWSSSVIGTGHIPRGHSDNDGTGPLDVSNALDHYDGTGNNSGEAPGSGWEQKRVHTLSNGSEIWDFAGNVWEWTDWVIGDGVATQGPTDGNTSWNEPTSLSGSITADEVQSLGGYDSSQSFGQWYGSAQGGPIRGGAYNRNAISGILAINFDANLSTGYVTTGFRCVYIP